jgi:Mrp family chromosome partitioning ATPase
MAIGQLTDGIVLILEAGATRREAAQAVTADLRTSKIPILGAVLNKRTFPIPEHIYKRL